VRASSHSTNASKRSDLPPAARRRGRAAATWLGCSASSRSPASSSRSTSSPSGRSIATNVTFNRTSVRHKDPQPLLIVRERARQQLLARLVLHEHVVLLRRPIHASVIAHLGTPLRSGHFTAPRPRGTVAGAYRQALTTGLRPVAAKSAPHHPPGEAGLDKALQRGKRYTPSPGGWSRQQP
jgi:hypothetical protein